MAISRAQASKQTKNAPASKAKKQAKVKKVMKEFKEGTLKSGGSGRKVKSRDQAIAIAMYRRKKKRNSK